LREVLADNDPRRPEWPIVDVIAVHGLGSKYPKTWTKDNKMWLRDFLPDDFPRARILAFVYPSEAFNNPDFVGLRALGGSLLRSLIKDREKLYSKRKRPLIFIGHSFGGLVIKEALALSQVSNSSIEGHHGYIADATRGVLFLGTPHFGSRYAFGGLLWTRLFEIFGKTYSGLLRTLQQLSPELEYLNQDFLAIPAIRKLPQRSLVCFYETKGLWFGVPVVDERSACLSTATRISLNGNHMDINKFTSRTGPYDDVKFCLQKIYDPLMELENPKKNENYYIFDVNTRTPGFNISDCYPSDLWSEEQGGMCLSMANSGTSGSIMFENKTSKERFAVTLGVHNYYPWSSIATNFGDETTQDIRDSYYGSGKRNNSSEWDGSRHRSAPLRAGRSAVLIVDEVEESKKRYPTEVNVK